MGATLTGTGLDTLVAAVATSDSSDPIFFLGFKYGSALGVLSNRPRKIGVDVVAFFDCCVFSDNFDIDKV